jgi:hypothetical protein
MMLGGGLNQWHPLIVSVLTVGRACKPVGRIAHIVVRLLNKIRSIIPQE